MLYDVCARSGVKVQVRAKRACSRRLGRGVARDGSTHLHESGWRLPDQIGLWHFSLEIPVGQDDWLACRKIARGCM